MQRRLGDSVEYQALDLSSGLDLRVMSSGLALGSKMSRAYLKKKKSIICRNPGFFSSSTDRLLGCLHFLAVKSNSSITFLYHFFKRFIYFRKGKGQRKGRVFFFFFFGKGES